MGTLWCLNIIASYPFGIIFNWSISTMHPPPSPNPSERKKENMKVLYSAKLWSNRKFRKLLFSGYKTRQGQLLLFSEHGCIAWYRSTFQFLKTRKADKVLVLFLCDIVFKALLTTQMSMFLFNHILGEKTLIKRFELSEKKTLESDSSSQLLNNWAHTHSTQTLEFAITTSQTSCIGFVWHLFFYCHEMCLHCFFTVRSPVNTAP